MNDYWQRQTADKPLFPAMLWSRPENRAFAGKLLIIGGNAQGFVSPANVYIEAQRAGIGVARVLLPDSLARTLGTAFEAGEFAPSTPSGSFSQKALAEWLDLANWADGVILDGDMGRNSETAIVIEKFLAKYPGQVTLSNDSVDYLLSPPMAAAALMRPNALIVANFSQLQKLFTAARSPRPLTSELNLVHFVEALHGFSLQHHAAIMTQHEGRVLIAVEGRVAETPARDKPGKAAPSWQTKAAAHAAVWWLQNPSRPYEALASSLVA